MKLLRIVATGLALLGPAGTASAADMSPPQVQADPVAMLQAYMQMLSERESQIAQLSGQIGYLNAQVQRLQNQLKAQDAMAKPKEEKK